LRILLQNDDEFVALRSSAFDAIAERVMPIEPIGGTGKDRWEAFSQVVVIAPRTNIEWVCPIERLLVPGGNPSDAPQSILGATEQALVFASSQRSPFPAMQIKVDPNQFRLHASTQLIGEQSIAEFVEKRFGDRVRRFDIGEPDGVNINDFDGEGIIVIAHRDQIEWLLTREFPQAKAIVLLVCSSGHYSLTHGPFVDGIALKLQDKLKDHGVVVGSRVPVEAEEAIRLADELLRETNRGRTVAEIVTNYLKSHRSANPFETPWIVQC